MEEKLIMGNILTLTKNICELLLHACIESPNNNDVLDDVLDEYLSLQHDIYSIMEQQGMYKISFVDDEKISQTKSKFENC